MLKQKYFLADIFILSAEKQPIKLSWREIVWLLYKWLIEALLSLNASDTDLNRVVKFISHNNPINLPSVESIKKEYDNKMEERRKAEDPIIIKVSINVNEA